MDMITRAIGTVDDFNYEHGLHLSPTIRILDITSELGELSKEVIKATDYGKKGFKPNDKVSDEYGDLLYSVISLGKEIGVNGEIALENALAKYEKRFSQSNTIGSDLEFDSKMKELECKLVLSPEKSALNDRPTYYIYNTKTNMPYWDMEMQDYASAILPVDIGFVEYIIGQK